MFNRARDKANTFIHGLGNIDPDKTMPSYKEATKTGNVLHFKAYENMERDVQRCDSEYKRLIQKRYDYNAEVERVRKKTEEDIEQAEYDLNTARDVLKQRIEQSFPGCNFQYPEQKPPNPEDLDIVFEQTPPPVPEEEQ